MYVTFDLLKIVWWPHFNSEEQYEGEIQKRQKDKQKEIERDREVHL
jgi:hypothetical protein